MKPLELVRQTLAENANISATELATLIEKKHGVKIDPSFVPVYKATLQQMEKSSRSTPGPLPPFTKQSLIR
jgi:hypothetical protein